MITVIIPTLMMSCNEIFSQTLKALNNCPLVKKIVIIDNSEEALFKNQPSKFDKIEVISYGKNIFVNPAWNEGLRKTNTEFFLILNDDVLLDDSSLFSCYDWATKHPNTGIITVKTIVGDSICDFQKELEKEKRNSLTVSNEIPNGRAGWFMFGRTRYWKEIPPSLKIFYGDDFIYYNFKAQGFQNCLISSGTLIFHDQSATVMNKNFLDIKTPVANEDHKQWPIIRHKFNF